MEDRGAKTSLHGDKPLYTRSRDLTQITYDLVTFSLRAVGYESGTSFVSLERRLPKPVSPDFRYAKGRLGSTRERRATSRPQKSTGRF